MKASYQEFSILCAGRLATFPLKLLLLQRVNSYINYLRYDIFSVIHSSGQFLSVYERIEYATAVLHSILEGVGELGGDSDGVALQKLNYRL